LRGGVPAAEVAAKQALFAALGFEVGCALGPGGTSDHYLDFAPTLTDRTAIRPLVENDPGVQARIAALRAALAAWWITHAPRLADCRNAAI
jgi:type I restriction enzyme M protein